MGEDGKENDSYDGDKNNGDNRKNEHRDGRFDCREPMHGHGHEYQQNDFINGERESGNRSENGNKLEYSVQQSDGGNNQQCAIYIAQECTTATEGSGQQEVETGTDKKTDRGAKQRSKANT
jgi:hypothetical protein